MSDGELDAAPALDGDSPLTLDPPAAPEPGDVVYAIGALDCGLEMAFDDGGRALPPSLRKVANAIVGRWRALFARVLARSR